MNPALPKNYKEVVRGDIDMEGRAGVNILGISCFYHDSATALVRDGYTA